MAIKVVKLANASASTDADGKVTITGERDEKGILSAATEVLLMPTKMNNDDQFVSESTAAISSTAWGVFGFHLADYFHAKDSGDAISPLTSLVV